MIKNERFVRTEDISFVIHSLILSNNVPQEFTQYLSEMARSVIQFIMYANLKVNLGSASPVYTFF